MNKEKLMWIVLFTWDAEEDGYQHWQEKRFESVHEAQEFVMSLSADGVAVTRLFKEPFNR